MIRKRARRAYGRVLLCLFAIAGLARCGKHPPGPEPNQDRPVIRIGLSNAPQFTTERGVQQFFVNQTNEGLLRVNQEGRIEAWLAESWERSSDGLRLTIQLRKPAPKFHDGTSADPETIATILNDQLTKSLKQWGENVESITANGDRILITFRRPSSFLIDGLMDVVIAKPGTPSIGVGAFKPSPTTRADGAQVIAHDQYYQGAPALGGLAAKTYPNIRAAWADMLRDQLDMLYEVGTDAIESMKGATNVSLYTFDRPYQYVVFLNSRSPKLKSAAIRQALNQAIDRTAFIRDALAGHGTASAGPVSSHHWAFRNGGTTFTYAPQAAAAVLPQGLTLTCYTLADQPYEQLALVLKQQLKAAGVELVIKEAPLEEMFAKLSGDDVEAALSDSASGWSLSRTYPWWHSKGARNVTRYANAHVDAAFDAIDHAVTDSDYKAAVADLQSAVETDPPAIFLAWSDRSRAISNRFDVKPEPRRDVLATLRQWQARADNRNTTTH